MKPNTFMDTFPKSLTLDHFTEQVCHKFSDKPALSLVEKPPISYAELSQKVQNVQNLLHQHGLTKGEKIILLGDNSPHWCVAFLAITGIGAVVVPVLSEFPESDISHIINHSEARAIFIDEKFYKAMDLQAMNNLKFIVSLDTLQLMEGSPSSGKKKSSGKSGQVNIQENDLAEILYTSGTTGHSKGVMLTHKNIVSNALAGPDAIGGIPQDSVILCLLPLAHAYGSTTSFLGAISEGALVYFIDRKPSPKILMDALQNVRPHIVTGVPLIFEKIFHKRVLPELTEHKILRFISRFNVGRNFLYRKIGNRIMDSFGGRLFSFVIGGASLNREVEIFLREANIPYAIGYGLSECSPLVCGDYYKHLKIGSVGRPAAGIEVKIDKPDHNSVGEILVKGPNVMREYYKNKQETNRVFTNDGWLKTGDLGYLDWEGHLFIKGRIKNVYVGPSGENIYPEVVEDRLRESMYVEEALVYFEEDRLIARVYLDYDYIHSILNAQKHTIQPQEIEQILETVRQETNTKLPVFSQIRKIFEQPEPFVKTPTNKIKRLLYVPNYLKN
jgi:long-chain acyl-CoA synthetase